MYVVRPLESDELVRWDNFVRRAENGHLFSSSQYLRHFERFEVLALFQGKHLVAGFPVPIVEQDGRTHIRRTSYLSPYFGPVHQRISGATVRADRVRRHYLGELIAYIQSRFESIVLPLNPQITDMMPFQQAHFQLELRYTYELELNSLDRLWRDMDPTVRNHIRCSPSVEIAADGDLLDFDFAAALSYEDPSAIEPWRRLVGELTRCGSGEVLVAHYSGRPVGGAFVGFDHRRAYNLLSYFANDCPVRGVPSKLIWTATQHAVARGLAWLDLEGSVLRSIEAFFQSFGGVRRPYFQVHWYANPALNKPVLYDYDTGMHR